MGFSVARIFLIMAVAMSVMASRCDKSYPITTAGKKAMVFTKELTDLGPRPSGSATLEKARGWIEKRVQDMGFSLQKDRFQAQTPLGPMDMKNLSYRIQGRISKSVVMLLAHYETKRFLGFDFVGANDASSSVALLLALSPDIEKGKFPFDVEIIFLDGEEALSEWSSTDKLYGSRHLAATLKQKERVRAAIVVDMIGDKDLQLVTSSLVQPVMMKRFKKVLAQNGWEKLLDPQPMRIEDDHLPLIETGIATLHLMDFTYGGDTSPGVYWHTSADTIDKISVVSLSVVGEIIVAMLKDLSYD